MKAVIYTSFGFAETRDRREIDIPNEVVQEGQEAIIQWLKEVEESIWESMLDQLSLRVTVKEE